MKYLVKECIYCGKEFIAKRKDAVSCGKRTSDHRINEKVNTTMTKCDCCGNLFKQAVSQYNRNKRDGRKSYCSQKCMGEAYKDRVTLRCSECGKEFQRAKSGYDPNNKHYFCSKDCQAKNIDYILRGKDHHRYIDGKSRNSRGKGWIRTRKELRKRDNYTCKMCGITEGELGKALDVHHIKPYRMFDDSEKANEQGNLISLCPSCHHKEEVAMTLLQ